LGVVFGEGGEEVRGDGIAGMGAEAEELNVFEGGALGIEEEGGVLEYFRVRAGAAVLVEGVCGAAEPHIGEGAVLGLIHDEGGDGSALAWL